MMRNIIHIICVFAALLVPALAGAQIVRKDSVPLHWAENNKKVIVDGDTVSMIIPERNYGRYDRGLFNYLYLPKGDWAFGFTASYGELNTDDVQVLSMLKMSTLPEKCTR